MRSGEPRTLEVRLTVAGTKRVYQVVEAPYRDGAASVIGVVGIARDVTEQRASTAAVRWISVLGRAFSRRGRRSPGGCWARRSTSPPQKQAEEERAELLAREQAALAEAQAAARAKDEFLAVALARAADAAAGDARLDADAGGAAPRRGHGAEGARDHRAQRQDAGAAHRGSARRVADRGGQAAPGRRRRATSPRSSGRRSSRRGRRPTTQARSGSSATIESAGGGGPSATRSGSSRWSPTCSRNAVKFTPSGGRDRACGSSAIGATARIAVEDSGCGISPGLLPHVFDRFRQAEGATTRRHGGLGLGLAIVRHLVEAARGHGDGREPGGGPGSHVHRDAARSSTAEPGAVAAERAGGRAEQPRGPRRARGRARPGGRRRSGRVRAARDRAPRGGRGGARGPLGARRPRRTSRRSARTCCSATSACPEEDGYALIRELRARESVQAAATSRPSP